MNYKNTLLAGAAALSLALAGCGSGQSPETPETEATETAETADASENALPEIIVTDAELEGNPFLADWDGAYGVPPFSEIEDDHFMPAMKKGILLARAEIESVINNPDAPTFENTILPLDSNGALVSKVAYAFSNMNATDTNDARQALASEIWPMLTREGDAVNLNPDLYARVKAVYDARDTLELGEQDARLLELTHLNFVRAGAAMDDASKARVKEINAELSALTTKFAQNLLAETKNFKIEITDEADLAGLSQDFRDAVKVDGEDKWEIGLNRSVYEGFMTASENRELREKLFNGYRLRGANGGDTDQSDVILKIARLRAERAELMGYKSHAHYQLETRMAKTPEGAEEFLLKVWRPGLARAKEELADIQALMDAEGNGFTAAGHDWWHYAEKVRQERFAFDDSVMKPYFELNNVREGAFDVAERLFEISIEEVEIDGWYPTVTSYDVKDAKTGEHLGLFMMDMWARDSKRGGAWMSSYRTSDADTRPIITNNMNLIEPPEGQPTLMRFEEVETLFHEFGHGLHGLLSQIDYQTFSGVDGPRDYTEFPAQILEHWASQTDVLNAYATHYETGEVIPQELVDKMKNAATFNGGFRTTEFIAASLLDLRWHMLSLEEANAITDARAFEKKVLEEYGLIPEIEPRYRSPYFSHIFAGGYSAGYYAYLWSEILDADGFEAFKETGDIFDPELAARLKKWVYESGGLRPADELYRNFRGADPSIEPLLKGRGFTDEGADG